VESEGEIRFATPAEAMVRERKIIDWSKGPDREEGGQTKEKRGHRKAFRNQRKGRGGIRKGEDQKLMQKKLDGQSERQFGDCAAQVCQS